METRFLNSISEIDKSEWNRLWNDAEDGGLPYPFTRHEFLWSLEASSSTTKETGWQPQHLCLFSEDTLVAAMPLFIKYHSYGEYVFDWSWADAYQNHGLSYYPKLLSAIPFTPATGPRLAVSKTVNNDERAKVLKKIFCELEQKNTSIRGSGFHCLFPSIDSQCLISQSNAKDILPNDSKLVKRVGSQFHWFNDAYTNFDDFLGQFTSRKRKTLKRERKRVAEQGITVEIKKARDVPEEDWKLFNLLYHRTYLKRSGRQGYLGNSFFQKLAATLSEHVILACAYQNNDMIAGALYLKDHTTLYGRYWGTKFDIDGLHFETCYYQGIEYAIKHGISRFDPGAQGEHKIQRGFTPIKTCSYHWLANKSFHNAVEKFVLEEAEHMEQYLQEACTYLPFKEGVPTVTNACLVEK